MGQSAQLVYGFPYSRNRRFLTVHGQAVVEVVTAPGFYSNSGGVSEVERNERESD